MSLLIGYISTIIGYIIPLSLIYSFVYSRSGGIYSMLLLFVFTYLIGVLACLLYYRMGIMGENAQIAKISNTKVKSIMATTALSYMLVLITIFTLGINRGLVEIFENTLGFFYIQLLGANKFANEIFTSPTLDIINKDSTVQDFNYGFLLTQFNSQNIQQFVTYFTENCKSRENSAPLIHNLPLDFTMKFDTQDQVNQLEDYVYTKHRIGHFSWIYFTSIISLTISMIAIGMK